jgi:hypothetical protein
VCIEEELREGCREQSRKEGHCNFLFSFSFFVSKYLELRSCSETSKRDACCSLNLSPLRLHCADARKNEMELEEEKAPQAWAVVGVVRSCRESSLSRVESTRNEAGEEQKATFWRIMEATSIEDLSQLCCKK